MQKRVRAAEVDVELDETPVENDITSAENAILAAVDATDQSVSWDIRIYKIDTTKGNTENWIFSVLPDELDSILTRCRDGLGYGTGVYRLRAYRIVGKDKHVFKQSDFRVLSQPAPAAAPERASEMATVLAAIQKQNEQTIELMRQLITDHRQPPVAQPDVFDTIAKVVGVIKGLSPTPAPVQASPQNEVFNAVLKGVELADRLNSDRGETTAFDLLKEAFRSLPALAQISNLQPSAQRRLPAPRAAAPAPGEAVIVDPAAMKQALAYLIGKAKRGANVEFYAAWITDNWEPNTIRWALAQPDLIAVLQSVEPEIAQHRQWFAGLIDALRQMVNNAVRDTQAARDAAGQGDTPGDAVADTGRQNGRAGDAANNERLGEGWEEEHPD